MDATHDSTAVTLAAASAFLLFAGGFWAIVSLGKWALAPVEGSTAAARFPAQFSLREFALLAIEMQLAVGAVFWLCPSEIATMPFVLTVGGALLAAWWHGVRRLAESNVTCHFRRDVFLMIVVPLATISIGAALWINGDAVLQTCTGQPWSIHTWLAGNLVIIGAFITCRLLTMWTMRAVTTPSAKQVPDDGIQYVS